MATQQKLQIIIDAENRADAALASVNSRLGGLRTSAESLEPAFKKMAAVGAVAFTGLAAVVFESVSAANEASAAQAQLGAVLESTHGAAGLYIEDLNDQAQALQRVTRYGDEAINTAQGLLLTFTNIKGPVFQEATNTILDMSTALGQDLSSSAMQLGKALNDPIIGIGALRKVGVSFSQDQEDVIKQLVKTGKTVEAQRMILKELNTEFGGSAVAAAQTFGGQLDIIKNQIGEVMEGIGNSLIPVLTQLAQKIEPVVFALVDWVSENPNVVAATLAIGLALSGLLVTVGLLGVALPAIITGFGLITGPVGAVIGVIAALGAIVYSMNLQWDNLMLDFDAKTGIITMIKDLWNDLVTVFTELLLPSLQQLWVALQPLAPIGTAMAQVFGGMLVFAIGAVILALKAAIVVIASILKFGADLATAVTNVWVAAFNSFGNILDWVISKVKALIDAISNLNIVKGAGSVISSVAGSVGNFFSGRATGGPVTGGTSYVVGENGPEIFTPGAYGRITPNGQIGGGMSIVITGNTFLGKEDVAREISDQIMKELRLNQRFA